MIYYEPGVSGILIHICLDSNHIPLHHSFRPYPWIVAQYRLD